MKKNLATFILPALLAVFAGSPAYTQGPAETHYAKDAPPPGADGKEARPPESRPPMGRWLLRTPERPVGLVRRSLGTAAGSWKALGEAQVSPRESRLSL